MGREVILTVDEQGNVELEVRGVKGPTCQELTRDLEKALGKVKGSKKTSEFYQTQTQQIRGKGT